MCGLRCRDVATEALLIENEVLAKGRGGGIDKGWVRIFGLEVKGIGVGGLGFTTEAELIENGMRLEGSGFSEYRFGLSIEGAGFDIWDLVKWLRGSCICPAGFIPPGRTGGLGVRGSDLGVGVDGGGCREAATEAALVGNGVLTKGVGVRAKGWDWMLGLEVKGTGF